MIAAGRLRDLAGKFVLERAEPLGMARHGKEFLKRGKKNASMRQLHIAEGSYCEAQATRPPLREDTN